MIYAVKQVKIRKIFVTLDTSHTLLIHRFIKFFMNLPGSASPKKRCSNFKMNFYGHPEIFNNYLNTLSTNSIVIGNLQDIHLAI